MRRRVLVQRCACCSQVFPEIWPVKPPRGALALLECSEDALLASIFTAGTAQVPLTDYFDALLQEVPLIRGVELVELHQGQQPRTIAQAGDASLIYHAAGFDYRVDHGAFFQVNRWLVDELVECVTSGQHGGLAWDLFAGVGLFARRLAEQFAAWLQWNPRRRRWPRWRKILQARARLP